jgi:hypothetical protein
MAAVAGAKDFKPDMAEIEQSLRAKLKARLMERQ